jgi:hypothetical protein
LVDPESVGARLRRLEQLLFVLEEIREQGRAPLLDDVRVQPQTEHALQVAIDDLRAFAAAAGREAEL